MNGDYVTTLPGPQENLVINKSYEFELNRVEDPQTGEGKQWVIAKFKFKDRTDIVENIFPGFLKKIDEYESNPQKSCTLFFKSLSERAFEIRFVKNSDDMVTGFVKELENIKEEYVKKEKKGMVKVSAQYKPESKDEMYKKIFQMMEDNEEARQDIFFYYLMVEKSELGL
jgi:hypothetical protein